jgi:cyclopropane-fatty-acyl-phospholipid synthase
VRTADRLHPARPARPRLGALERGILSVVGGRVRVGRLTVDLPDGSRRVFDGKGDGPHAQVELRDGRLLRRVATTGAIGLADGYIAGEYGTDDLASFIELAALHVEPAHRTRVPAALDRGGRALWRALGRGAAPRGPLRDIVQHYDLGNAFYALWLDPTMTYSSAVFARDEMTLEEAQREKYRRLAEATGVREGEHVVEIGSGWGGFAAYLAAELGARVTTLTVSREQATWVEALIARRGLRDRVQVRLEDFAEHRGTYDRAVSVEMIESIPRGRWDGYFGALRRLVRPGGTIGLQVITVADHHWDDSNRNPDFIRRYIFPGGQVPAPKVLHALTARHGLEWRTHEEHGASYARTLRCWREAFEAHWHEIEALGFDEPFRRMWRYYLAYCEGGFRAGRVDVGQIVLTRS